jgi:hypothetical protein
MLTLVRAFAALTVMSMSAYAQSDAETGRIQITFIKAEVYSESLWNEHKEPWLATPPE